jgi:hypothetical protein
LIPPRLCGLCIFGASLYFAVQSGFQIGVRVHRTLMTQILRIDADPFPVLSATTCRIRVIRVLIDASFAAKTNC